LTILKPAYASGAVAPVTAGGVLYADPGHTRPVTGYGPDGTVTNFAHQYWYLLPYAPANYYDACVTGFYADISSQVVGWTGSQVGVGGYCVYDSSHNAATQFPNDWVGTFQTCPDNSTGTPATNPTSCTCNDKYQPDPFHVGCAKVPDAICSIPGLPPLTDPAAKDFDNNVGSRWRPDLLTTDYQKKLKCVEDEITARGGSYVGTSAYRPEQYQRHLYEIVQKDKQLYPGYMATHPECQSLRDTITQEMGPPPGHDLKPGQPVALPGKSRHESGEAFDLTPSDLTDVQLAPIYSDCGVTHIVVHNEPWHVQ
jgi:hypothetical protein